MSWDLRGSLNGPNSILRFVNEYSGPETVHFWHTRAKLWPSNGWERYSWETQKDPVRPKAWDEFCLSHGIAHQNAPPPPYPKLNGVAERFNRTLLDRILPSFFKTYLTVRFWEEAAHHAVSFMNLSPSQENLHWGCPNLSGNVNNLCTLNSNPLDARRARCIRVRLARSWMRRADGMCFCTVYPGWWVDVIGCWPTKSGKVRGYAIPWRHISWSRCCMSKDNLGLDRVDTCLGAEKAEGAPHDKWKSGVQPAGRSQNHRINA